MLRSLGNDLAKLSLIDVAGWNLHDTIIAPAVASRELATGATTFRNPAHNASVAAELSKTVSESRPTPLAAR